MMPPPQMTTSYVSLLAEKQRRPADLLLALTNASHHLAAVEAAWHPSIDER